MPRGIYIRTQLARENMGKAQLGNKNGAGNKENSLSEKQKLKISKNRKGKGLNEKNGAWKGDEATYEAVHAWVRLRLGNATKCMKNKLHISTRYHWANISGKYKREISDWQSLCPSCNRLDGVKINTRFKKEVIA